MAESFYTGDMVLVNKLAFNYQVKDVLYFEFPAKDSGSKKTHFIQRCIAEPGDSLRIIDKLIYVNGHLVEDLFSIKYNYILDTDTFKLDSLTKERYDLYEGGEISKKGKYAYSLTKSQIDSLNSSGLIKSIDLRLEKTNIYDARTFPFSRQFSWNIDNYGPIYIPKKNDTLLLDTINIKLYSTIITKFEKNELLIKGDSIYINNTYTKNYTIKQNYYFVAGDNRDNAIDSRRWGFLPKSFIKGKVVGILTHGNRK